MTEHDNEHVRENSPQKAESSNTGQNAHSLFKLDDFQNGKNPVQLQLIVDRYVDNKYPIQRKNNTGLPDRLKTGIEGLSGYSMDDVKVHYNSKKPAQLQAHAYAQGNQIHIAPGQEKHLPHEAWHVVQQKQGRVKPTRQLKSKTNINDDEKLEREADLMGARADNLHLKSETLETSQISHKNTVQRAVAFEAESKGIWKVQGKKDLGDNFAQISDTKAPLGSKGKVDITSDSGNLEFVTKPLNGAAEVKNAFETMIIALDALAAGSPVDIGNLPKDEAGLTWTSVKGYILYRLKALSRAGGKSNTAIFLPQATLDIPFDKFDTFITKYEEEKTGNDELIGNTFAETAGYIQKNPVTNFLTGLPAMTVLNPATTGFLQMVLMALYDAFTFRGGDDPKYAFSAMPRNRFSEMFTAANLESSNQLQTVFPIFAGNIVAARSEFPHLFMRGYKGDNGMATGPTVQQWFDSIVNPVFMEGDFADAKATPRKSDLLSPPPGQRTKREGLGAYNLAGGTVPFFELRDFLSSFSSDKPKTLVEIYEGAMELVKFEEAMNENPMDAIDEEEEESPSSDYSPVGYAGGAAKRAKIEK